MIATDIPFRQYSDSTGLPLDGGYIYFGQSGQNPETAPITVYWDEAGTIPAAQPIRTINGFAIHDGNIANIYCNVDYSITIKNRVGAIVAYAASAINSAIVAHIENIFAASTGASLIGGGGQVVSSIAALRLLLKTCPSKHAFVTGYYAAGDGGGGQYYYDASDTTSADNAGTVIVAADGGRWKLARTASLSVKQFGAKGDGTTDDTAAFNAAIAVVTSRMIIPAGKYKLTSGLVFSNKNGFTLEGEAAALIANGTTYTNNSVLVFDSAVSGTTGVKFDTFIGISIRNLSISQMRGGAGGGFGLYMRSGHDFRIENVKVSSNVGSAGAGIVLGDGTGAGCSFQGTLDNCKVMTAGEQSIVSNSSNTSLSFRSCYANGGSVAITGTLYSSFDGCAADGVSTGFYGYTINNCQGLTFNGCGAEANSRGAFYIAQSSSNIILNAPLGAANNSSAVAGTGALVHIDSSIGACFGITINNPTSIAPNAASTADIYATVGTGRVTVNDVTGAKLPKGISGDSTWQLTKLMTTGDTAVRAFTPTQGSGWTFTGTPTFSGTFVRYGNRISFQINITGHTNVSSATGATINLPFAPSAFGTCNFFDDNTAFIGGCLITSAGVISLPIFTARTVALRLVGEFITSD